MCGASGGGPHALAIGALLPELVTGVAVICSLAPRDASGLDYLAGMQDDIAQIHRWFDDDDLGAVRAWATNYRTEVEGYSAEQIEQLAAEAFPDDAGSQTFFRGYTKSVRLALEPGIEGIVDDGVAFHGSWGFEVGSIGAPIRLWSGPADLHVPLAHSRWLGAQLPGAPRRCFGEWWAPRDHRYGAARCPQVARGATLTEADNVELSQPPDPTGEAPWSPTPSVN